MRRKCKYKPTWTATLSAICWLLVTLHQVTGNFNSGDGAWGEGVTDSEGNEVPTPEVTGNDRCVISGDPHYRTFDGRLISFMGLCKYKLVAVLPGAVTNHGQADFIINGKNAQRDGKTQVSYLDSVELILIEEGVTVETIVIGQGRAVTVNGDPVDKHFLTPKDVSIEWYLPYTRLKTTFDVEVYFDGVGTAWILLPKAYRDCVYGMCGDFDDSPNNDLNTCTEPTATPHELPDDYPENAVSLLGASCHVDVAGETCTTAVSTTDLTPCGGIAADITTATQECAFYDNAIFAPCRATNAVDFPGQKEACVFDVCARSITADRTEAKCAALAILAEECRRAGETVDWRTQAGCPLACASWQTYRLSASPCENTCETPTAEASCGVTSPVERCGCPAGHLVYADSECVASVDLCPCVSPDGQRGTVGDTWYAKTMCARFYSCQLCTGASCTSRLTLVDNAFTCAPTQTCQEQNGRFQCFNTPVDGGWTDYSAWSECSGDQETRTRNCTNPAPAWGGADCSGDGSQSRDCQVAVDGGWSSWGDWGLCTSPSSGTRTRTRTCDNPRTLQGGSDCATDVAGASESANCGSFVAFGPTMGDVQLARLDDGSSESINIPQDFQLFGGTHKTLNIYINGYITLDAHYDRFTPSQLPISTKALKGGLLAAFWTDIDCTYYKTAADNIIYYNLYTRLTKKTVLTDPQKAIFDKAMKYVERTGDTGFSATQVIVITWLKVVPAPSIEYYSSDMRATFQMVLIQDAATMRTYTVWNYEVTSWEQDRDFVVWLGYQSKDREFFNHVHSGTNAMFTMAENYPDPDSGGTCGSITMKTTWPHNEVTYNPGFRCLVWEEEEEKNAATIALYDLFLPQCPCSLSQAIQDPNIRLPWGIFPPHLSCIVTNWFNPGVLEGGRICCYLPEWLRIDPNPLLMGHTYDYGSIVLYNPLYMEPLYFLYDDFPKVECCLESSKCDHYYSRRPQGSCTFYKPPFYFWVGGDPHITTPDGLSYTFNGKGEFWLIQTNDSSFSLQGRTIQAQDANGNLTQATIFSAFAATAVNSSILHVGLDAAKTGMIIRRNYKFEHTDWFYSTEAATNATSAIDNQDGLVLTRDTTATIPTLKATFANAGVLLKLSVSAGQVSCVSSLNSNLEHKTHGLYGTFNGEKNDDLTARDGTVLPPDSSDADIYIFGQSWLITTGKPLFYYEPGTDASTFTDRTFKPQLTPTFKDTELEQKAQELCGGDKACLFDFAATGDEAVAMDTAQSIKTTAEVKAVIENKAPQIYGPTLIRATVGEEISAIFSANDSDADDKVEIKAMGMPPGATLTMDPAGDSGTLTWTPTVTSIMDEPSTFSFTATDSRGMAASAVDVTVALCDCNDHGACVWERAQAGYNTSNRFYMVDCMCRPAWEGDFCKEDFNGCEASPCGILQNCTDVAADVHDSTEQGYMCSECPSGFITAGTKCQDINECNTATPCDSSNSDCLNTRGSYRCNCKKGYTQVNPTTCTDVNECEIGLANCQQTCVNTVGSFLCKCFAGNDLDADGITCVPHQTIESECNDKDCAYACQQNIAITNKIEVECACPAGAKVDADGKTCIDINECTQTVGVDPCGLHGTCVNTEPGYTCTCDPGYRLDSNRRDCIPCPMGKWGDNCTKMCNCRNSSTACLPDTGCEECSDAYLDVGDCSTDRDECEEDATVCGANATCVNLHGSYRCDCHDGFVRQGSKCELEDYCAKQPENPCQNGGVCQKAFMNFTCKCRAGFIGERCEKDVDECASSPCQHEGDCMNLENRWQCQCTNAYSGVACEEETKRLVNVMFAILSTDNNTDEATLTEALTQPLENIFLTTYPSFFIKSNEVRYGLSDGGLKTLMVTMVVKGTLMRSAEKIGQDFLEFLSKNGYILGIYEIDRQSVSVDEIPIKIPAPSGEPEAGKSRVLTLDFTIKSPWHPALSSYSTSRSTTLREKLEYEVTDLYQTEYLDLFLMVTNLRFSEGSEGNIHVQMENVLEEELQATDAAIRNVLQSRDSIAGFQLIGNVESADATAKSSRQKIRIINKTYVSALANKTTSAYIVMRDEIKRTVEPVYKDKLPKLFLWTQHYVFRPGSVEALYTVVTLPGAGSDQQVSDKLREALDSSGYLDNLQLDRAAVTPADQLDNQPEVSKSRVVTLEFLLEKAWVGTLVSASTDDFKTLRGQIKPDLDTAYRDKYGNKFLISTNMRFSSDSYGNVQVIVEVVLETSVTDTNDVISSVVGGTPSLGNFKSVPWSPSSKDASPELKFLTIRILDKNYETSLSNSQSMEYADMRALVQAELHPALNKIAEKYFLWTENYDFRNGSLVTSLTMVLLPGGPSSQNIAAGLKSQLTPAPENFLGNLKLDPESIIVTGGQMTTASPTTPNATIIGASVGGAVLALLLLILTVILVIVLLRRRNTKSRQRRRRREPEDLSDEVGHFDFPGPYPRRMHWQYAESLPTSQSLPSSPYDDDDLDEMRSRHNARLVNRAPPINWGVLRKFSERSPYSYHYAGPQHGVPLPGLAPGEFAWLPSSGRPAYAE